jgi:UDPglucose--hexose-1-phosphate uridylyltransferase
VEGFGEAPRGYPASPKCLFPAQQGGFAALLGGKSKEGKMPELRQNMATKEWVIIATERAKRPEQFVQPDKERVEDRPAYAAGCPFCPGNEELDLERLRLPEEGDWIVRVVQNRYPALRESGDRAENIGGLSSSIAGVGYHDVVVESRLHNTSPATEAIEEIERTLRAFQIRGLDMRADKRIEQIVFFKNHGAAAGASLLHPHAQMLGMPVVPSSIRGRAEEARRYYEEHGECVICRMRQEEQREQARIVVDSPFFSAFIPFAAFSPFHLWIIPRLHHASFLDTAPEELHDLALVLHKILHKIYVGLNDPDYNYVIRSAPIHEAEAEHLHWYIAVVPRVTRMAGFEMGTGMFINTALPEESAQFLRSIAPH